MKQSQWDKKLGLIFVTILIMVLCSTGCQRGSRVISNPDSDAQPVAAGSSEPAPGNAEALETVVPGSTNDKSDPEEELKDAENSEYQGYKGPVQGEIKYKEGTPAGENARSYKASGDIQSPYHIDLIVTRDYGHSKMFGKTVGLVRDEVGMEVLFRNLDIQTAYGGGFVNAINGLESGFTFFTGSDRKKHDWFYWVNGILGPVGIAEYRPQPGDIVWWDYHDWSMTMFIPAVIGSYPQPFKNGFWGKNPGTVVMYIPGYEADASRLKQSLESQGVTQVDTTAFDPQVLQAPHKYYILLGPWNDMAEQSSLIADVNKKNKFAGVYVKFENGEVKGLDFKGNAVSSHAEAGAVFAYGASIGQLNPVWVVTGNNAAGVKMAVDLLITDPAAVRGCFGAVITRDGVINVPYIN